MKRITVDLEEAQFERLRKAAFDRREPMSAIIREALAKELREPEPASPGKEKRQ